MPVTQISVFLESQPGHLKSVLDTFETVGVNVRGYSASDTPDYGIARFIVDRPAEAFDVLHDKGYAVKLSEVLCVRLADKPGELARLMTVIADAGINVKYSYSLISTMIAICAEDIESAERALQNKPIILISQEDLQNQSY